MIYLKNKSASKLIGLLSSRNTINMDYIKKLYKKLWKSLIRPQRYYYNEHDLGGEYVVFPESQAVRMDFKLKNALKEEFNLSIYFPCDEEQRVSPAIDFVVYAHTHCGTRVEGLHLAEKIIDAGFGLAVFDFRANGFSTGKYVTLGWFEALDLNEVVKFLKTEVRARKICIWGRSMGASAAVFFLSPVFRAEMDLFLKEQRAVVSNNTQSTNQEADKFKNKDMRTLTAEVKSLNVRTELNEKEIRQQYSNRVEGDYKWAKIEWIDCLILDSCFTSLNDCVVSLVNNKAPLVPNFVAELAIKLIASEVKTQTKVDVGRIRPTDHSKYLSTPLFMIVGDKDELVVTSLYQDFFSKAGSKIKRLRIFNGSHADERPAELYNEMLRFCKTILVTGEHDNDTTSQRTLSLSMANAPNTMNKTSKRLGIFDKGDVGTLKTNRTIVKNDKMKVIKPNFFGFHRSSTEIDDEVKERAELAFRSNNFDSDFERNKESSMYFDNLMNQDNTLIRNVHSVDVKNPKKEEDDLSDTYNLSFRFIGGSVFGSTLTNNPNRKPVQIEPRFTTPKEEISKDQNPQDLPASRFVNHKPQEHNFQKKLQPFAEVGFTTQSAYASRRPNNTISNSQYKPVYVPEYTNPSMDPQLFDKNTPNSMNRMSYNPGANENRMSYNPGVNENRMSQTRTSFMVHQQEIRPGHFIRQNTEPNIRIYHTQNVNSLNRPRTPPKDLQRTKDELPPSDHVVLSPILKKYF